MDSPTSVRKVEQRYIDYYIPKAIEVARRLRCAHVSTPILMLTARDDTSDKIGGLDCGADD